VVVANQKVFCVKIEWEEPFFSVYLLIVEAPRDLGKSTASIRHKAFDLFVECRSRICVLKDEVYVCASLLIN
jgi:hypothetical protein